MEETSGIAPRFPIRDFGAACDGVTDDTAAVQAAVDAALRYDERLPRHVPEPSGFESLIRRLGVRPRAGRRH